MKKIVCYGDSNTFGYNPSDASRFNEDTRWTAILQKNLKGEYKIIEEGVCDRTGFVDNDKGFTFSAQRHFPEYIKNIGNIDILIIALGTNDLQFKYDLNSEQIKQGLENLILISKNMAKRIIIIPPVILDDNILNGYFNCQFDKTSILKSKIVSDIYKQIAKVHKCEIFDINNFTKPSDVDGLHYDKPAHKFIADELTEFILQNTIQ